MGLVIYLFVFIFFTASVDCGQLCDDPQKLMSDLFDCFPKEFLDLQKQRNLMWNLSEVIDRLDEDDGYKMFDLDYKSMDTGCKKTTVNNIVTCYRSIFRSCNITEADTYIGYIKESYEILCNNSHYLSEQECCLQRSYVYQTPCIRTELMKYRSQTQGFMHPDVSKRLSCSLNTCMTSCMTQAVQIAKCEPKLENVVSAFSKPPSSICVGIPTNTTFDCAESKYIDVSIACTASLISASALSPIIAVLIKILRLT